MATRVELSPGKQAKLNEYLDAFPTPSARLERALQLAHEDSNMHPKTAPVVYWHNLLHAHWGEDGKGLRALTKYVLSVMAAANDWAGQSVLVLKTPLATADQTVNDAPSIFPAPIDVEVGTLTGRNVFFGFRGNLAKSGTDRWGVPSKSLRVGLGVLAVDQQPLTFFHSGLVITEPTRPTPGPIITYRASIPLGDDPSSYYKELTSECYPAVFGNAAVHGWLRRVINATDPKSGATKRFADATARGLIGPGQPLSDLTGLLGAEFTEITTG